MNKNKGILSIYASINFNIILVRLSLSSMTKKEMIKNAFALFILLVFMVSCIPNKDIIYLQESKSEPKDSSMVMSKINIQPYRVQSLDILSVILKAPEEKIVEMFKAEKGDGVVSQETIYFNGFTVDDKGFIRIPVLGEVQVLGLTLEEIRVRIEEMLLKNYFNEDANIFVEVKLPGVSYTINGEITHPGVNVVYKDRATILEAIAVSGDITPVGNRKEVMIIRQYPHGSEIHSIDLTTIDAMNSPYYFIQPNDYIYIKPLKQKSWGTGVNGIDSVTRIFQVFTIASTVVLLFFNLR